MSDQAFNVDAYAPAEMAKRVETVGVAKANLSRQWTFDGYQVGATAVNIAVAKVNHGFLPAFALGVFCNALVCLAVWLCFSARTTTDRIVAIIPPITAFVASGFEHSITNRYFIPIGLFVRGDVHVIERVGQPAEQFAHLTWAGFFIRNLFPVTLGNMVGGAVMVAAVYWFVYLREQPGNRLVRTWRHLGRSRVHADRAANDQDGEQANH
jgi:formate transporter